MPIDDETKTSHGDRADIIWAYHSEDNPEIQMQNLMPLPQIKKIEENLEVMRSPTMKVDLTI